MGDKSDNIKQVFPKCGPKTALKWTKDKAALKNILKESQDAASRYLLNKKIISFKEIPTELSNTILEKVNVALYTNEQINNSTIDLRDFMSL
jgi:5'-3' exonuclease